MMITANWDGRPPNPERSGYHWLRRIDTGSPMPLVIWTWLIFVGSGTYE